MIRSIVQYAAALAFALVPLAGAAQPVAGQVLWASGAVASIGPDKVVRPLSKGDAVHSGELVSTGAESHVQLLMKDQGLIALRPDSSLHLATYAYDASKDGNNGSAVMNLVKGGFRSITGVIGATNKDNFQIRAKTVLLGIRGTDHETFLQPDSGVYNRVTEGGTFMQTEAGRVELDPGQTGFASLEAPPALLQRTPEFMHLTKIAAPAGAPFNGGVIAHGKRMLPEQATLPVLPGQAWGDNAHRIGWGKGGRCAGPCNDVLVGKGIGKGLGKGRP